MRWYKMRLYQSGAHPRAAPSQPHMGVGKVRTGRGSRARGGGGVQGTLEDALRYLRKYGVPLGYLQLESVFHNFTGKGCTATKLLPVYFRKYSKQQR
jgi:hypothetical protein